MITKSFQRGWIFFFLISCLSEEAGAITSCFSFIPYGYNGSFVQLPRNKKFCFHYSNKKTHISTNKLGGRIIENSGSANSIIAFGESQLLGLDYSDLQPKNQHDLSRFFPSQRLVIYAAPNNGPLEALEQIKSIHSEDSLNGKDIVVGFNYGTDIFRIQEQWDPENFVPMDASQLERSFNLPGYFELILFFARIRGVKFGSTVSNSKSVREFYTKINDHQRVQSIERWLNKLKKSDLKFAKFRYFLLYPPYWYLGADESNKLKIAQQYKEFACKVSKSEIFGLIFVAELPDEDVKLASDNRHFLSGENHFTAFDC